MSTSAPPLGSGQWLPCVSEKEKWVLVIADSGTVPNRLGKGQATGGREGQGQCLWLMVGRHWGCGPGGAELLSREKVKEP